MHNKFAVIDGTTVWTGSFNLTENCRTGTTNNATRSGRRSSPAYSGPSSRRCTRSAFRQQEGAGDIPFLSESKLRQDRGHPHHAYFSPEDNIERILLKRIRKAHTSVHFNGLFPSQRRAGEELIRIFKEGRAVCGIMEREGSDGRDSEYVKMKLEGIPVRLDKNRHIMHTR